MAQMMNSSNLRQMKDFLEIFNKVTEQCFNNCVNTFADRELTSDEAVCLDRISAMTVSLLCLVGIPGSGKTTLARAIELYVQDRDGVVILIEYDSHIDESVYARGEWKDSRNNLLGRIENTAKELGSTGRRAVVILDDNFFYKSMRYNVFKVAKKLRLGFGQVFLDVPLEVCLQRNQLRMDPLSSDTISKMSAVLEPPEPSRNPWEEYSVSCYGDGDDLETIYDLIIKTWTNPCFENPPIHSLPQENSNLHYADLALRQIIKSMVQSTPPDQRQELTRSLALKKKRVLEDLKMMNIILPNSSGSGSVPIYVAFLEPFMSQ